MDSLREDKSGGPDDLPPRLLKIIKEEICTSLTIFQCSEGMVPTDWRMANVSPIYKKGKKSLDENYRSISLTSQISKVFEAIVRDALVSHLDSNDLLRNTQHGFRSGKSCLSNLLVFLDKVTKCMEDGDNRYISISQRHSTKFTCGTWYWQQGLVVGLVSGSKEYVSTVNSQLGDQYGDGVPQGSVLGPIYCSSVICINDIDFRMEYI